MGITWQMRLKLEVQADAPDFDLWAQVLMILPDRSSIKLVEDIRRARFRDSVFKAELLRPDDIVEISWMARRIPAGARLRVAIAPLNSPANQKNYNTGGRLGYEKIEDARIKYQGLPRWKARELLDATAGSYSLKPGQSFCASRAMNRCIERFLEPTLVNGLKS